MSDANYWLKLAKLDQGVVGTNLSLSNYETTKQATCFVGILSIGAQYPGDAQNDLVSQRVQKKISNLNGMRVINKVKKVVSHDLREIKDTLISWSDNLGLNLILTTGGTGFSPDHQCPEATKAILEKEAPGLTMAMVGGGLKLNPIAMLYRTFVNALGDESIFAEKANSKFEPGLGVEGWGSALMYRGVCGIRKGVLVINLPDGEQAATDFLDRVMPVLPFAFAQLKNTPTSNAFVPSNPLSNSLSYGLQKNPFATFASSEPAAPAANDQHHAPTTHGLQNVLQHETAGHHAQHEPVSHHREETAHHGVAEHTTSNNFGLVSADDINLFGEEQPPPFSESVRIVGSRPASRTTVTADSGVALSSIDEADISKSAWRKRTSPYQSVGMDKAYSLVLANSTPLPATTVLFKDALDSVVAEDVRAKISVPARPTAINDGYAVISSSVPGELEVIGATTVGTINVPQPYLSIGKAVKITTGAPIPNGADAVILVENTIILSEGNTPFREKRIRCNVRVTPGENIRAVGSDIQQTELLLQAGTKLDYSAIGLLPSTNNTSVVVHRPPVVAILSVGNELVEPDSSNVSEGQVRDTNRITLSSALRKLGFPVVDCGIVSDGSSEFRKALLNACNQADVIITTGGCAVGENDFVKPVLTEIGATLQFGRVFCKPGAPTAFATLETQRGKKLFFALPGVPCPALVAFHILVCPCLRRLRGERVSFPTVIKVKLSSSVQLSDVPEYQRAKLRYEDNDPVPYGDVTGRQPISRFLSMVGANILLLLPAQNENRSAFRRGELCDAMVVGQI